MATPVNNNGVDLSNAAQLPEEERRKLYIQAFGKDITALDQQNIRLGDWDKVNARLSTLETKRRTLDQLDKKIPGVKKTDFAESLPMEEIDTVLKPGQEAVKRLDADQLSKQLASTGAGATSLQKAQLRQAQDQAASQQVQQSAGAGQQERTAIIRASLQERVRRQQLAAAQNQQQIQQATAIQNLIEDQILKDRALAAAERFAAAQDTEGILGFFSNIVGSVGGALGKVV
ncbi:MAG: hypothetical protein E6R03_17625 [Hyphomicrobiaceae bacterium]|nr:MAG: hypothetical protein E6R03_17625 [Hyphomicrobiaceae bacterium]